MVAGNTSEQALSGPRHITAFRLAPLWGEWLFGARDNGHMDWKRQKITCLSSPTPLAGRPEKGQEPTLRDAEGIICLDPKMKKISSAPRPRT